MKTILILVLLLVLCSGLLLTKPALEVKLLNSFTLDSLQGNWNSVRPCVADTLLLVIDTTDSTKTASYAYDFQGNRIYPFKIPADSCYGQFFFVNYLYDTHRLALCGTRTINIDYFSLEGKPLDSKPCVSDWSLYLNSLEWNKTPYYIVFNLREAEYGEIVTSSMTWCREKSDGQMQQLRKACFVHETQKSSSRPFPYHLLMDNNKDEYMTMVDERENEYVVSNPDTSSWNVIRIKRKKADHLSKVVTGENYFLLMTWNDRMKYTRTSGAYDMQGKKILSWSDLKKYETKGNGIIDIVGNKMVTIHWKDNKVRIYKISLAANR